jgi:broad-specificity NMP kinase
MNPCPHCDHSRYPITWLPLFVITGSSGCGKTAVTQKLVGQMDSCIFLESDYFLLVQDTCTSAQDYWNFLILQCMQLVRNKRSPVLSGWVNPSQIETLPRAKFFSAVHFLVLTCDQATQTERLKARYLKNPPALPAQQKIETALRGTRHLQEEAETRPNVTELDTTHMTLDQTALATERWIMECLNT